ncbi:hypothetical protein M5K25_027543 [Dendrobium thyrsiflorum]|uniref:Uncharacterized protein n=1 Tax=Dendrobium thyrsiflorum TaxID=117978 RepID=A0ABD0TU42_DENTH
MKKGLIKTGKRALQINLNVKRLEDDVKKLDKISVDVGNFLHLLESAKQILQEQLLKPCRACETGSLPKSELIS